MRVRFTLSIGIANARQADEMEIERPPGLDDEQFETFMEAEYRQWRDNFLDGGWEVLDNA
jgi:hypothetical protein